MKYRILTAFTLLLLLATSCEKSLSADEGGPQDGDAPAAKISDADKQNALTISEAWEIADGTKVCVKGYLIAATQNSISNCTFSAPFKGTTAIVLSEQPITGSDQVIFEEDLFPVCLRDATKGIRDKYNLVDHPENWNHIVYIIGTRVEYMSMPGLNKITAIEVGEAYQPEEPVTPDDPVTPDNPITPDNPDDPIDPVDPDEPTPDATVLTVAEAHSIDSGDIITVRGYIVASVTYSKEYIRFENSEEPFHKTAIVLADKPYDKSKAYTEQFDLNNFTDLFPVMLYDNKAIQDEINLADHPKFQNSLIEITGRKDSYIMRHGMKEITAYKIIQMATE